MSVNSLLIKMKCWIKNVFLSVISIVLKICPIKNERIIFLNFRGRGYGDNPGYVSEYLRINYPNLDLVWVVRDKKEKLPEGIRTVKYGSIQSFYEQATSKVWVYNVRMFPRIFKRDKQYYVQTWHGPCALKKIEAQIEEILNYEYIKNAKYDGKVTDLMISSSSFQSEQIKSDFWFKGEIFEVGTPRNDYLVLNKDNLEEKERIKNKLGIFEQCRVVMYAPTFRDGSLNNDYELSFERLMQACTTYFEKNCVLLVRLHPNLEREAKKINYNPDIINASLYPDMSELLLITDFLITDYSSSIFDYGIIGGPTVLYAYDIEEYEKTRGLNQVFYELPFPIAKNEEELSNCILNYNAHFKKEIAKEFWKKQNSFEKGTASRDIGERIVRIINKGANK